MTKPADSRELACYLSQLFGSFDLNDGGLCLSLLDCHHLVLCSIFLPLRYHRICCSPRVSLVRLSVSEVFQITSGSYSATMVYVVNCTIYDCKVAHFWCDIFVRRLIFLPADFQRFLTLCLVSGILVQFLIIRLRRPIFIRINVW